MEKKTLEGIFGLVLIGIIIWWLWPNKKPDAVSIAHAPPAQQEPKSSPDKEIYQTTARHLFAEYEQNEVATDERIKDKKVILLGVIQAINKNAFNTIVVNLYTNNQFMPAMMGMNDSVKARVLNLKKGDKVAITCESISRIMGSPSGANCMFTDTVQPLPTYR